MPYSLTIALETDAPEQLPKNSRRALHANFYDWLQGGDRHLAEEVHSGDGSKPFTISPVWPAGEERRFRITLLRDNLWPPLEKGFSQASSVDIVGQGVSIAGAEAEYRSYEEIWGKAKEDRKIRLTFLSPTSFRSQGMHYPLPDPLLVFRSYLSQWNECAPSRLRFNVNTLDVVEAHVALSYHRLHTEVVDFDRYKQIGFVGMVQYTVTKAHLLGSEILKRLNALGDYAYFCGTGHKTTQGMGQTKRI